MRVFILIMCVLFCVASAYEIKLERFRRQTGLNGAHTDAIDRARDGGLGGSHNPLQTPGGFGARLGAGYGGTVYEGGSSSVGLGGAIRADVGVNGGSPFVRAPEVGVGATYNSGPNSFGLGAGRTFGSNPSNQIGFTYSRQFRRAADYAIVERRRRQTNSPALNTAMTNSLTNKPVGDPQFSLHLQGAGNSASNFGAAGSAGSGLKLWENGPQSVGLGVGASGNLARVDGKTYTGNPQLGVGMGYQDGPFSASVGAARETSGPFRGNQFGLSLGYKFRRSVDFDEFDHTKEALNAFLVDPDELNHTKEALDKRSADIDELNHTKEALDEIDELNHTKEALD